jgi:hypothetical protein
MQFEYHQEFLPVEHVGNLQGTCNAAAEDGWQMKSMNGPIGIATSKLTGAPVIPVFVLLFERPKAEQPISNGAIRGVSRIQHDGK